MAVTRKNFLKAFEFLQQFGEQTFPTCYTMWETSLKKTDVDLLKLGHWEKLRWRFRVWRRDEPDRCAIFSYEKTCNFEIQSIHNFSSSVCEYFRSISVHVAHGYSPVREIFREFATPASVVGTSFTIFKWNRKPRNCVIPLPDELFRLTRWSVTRETTRVDFDPRRQCSRTFQADCPRVMVNDHAEVVWSKGTISVLFVPSLFLFFFFFFRGGNKARIDSSATCRRIL